MDEEEDRTHSVTSDDDDDDDDARGDKRQRLWLYSESSDTFEAMHPKSVQYRFMYDYISHLCSYHWQHTGHFQSLGIS